MNVERILLATDFSAPAAGAEAYASMLAESWRAALTVVHVLEFAPGLNPDYPVNRLYLDELRKQAAQAMADLEARTAAQGLSIRTSVVAGIPSKEVLALAEADDVDLIVIGTAGKTGLEHVLLGSTAERVIRMSPCPVLAVRAERPGVESGSQRIRPGAIGNVLIPVDFSDCSLDALEYGVVVARQAKASVTLLHVLEPVSYGLDFTLTLPSSRQHQREAVEERLAGVVGALDALHVKCEYVVRGGLPNDSILEVARTRQADMIVMGTHGRRGLSHVLYGSVAESVLRKSRCPVLMVRSPKFRPGHRRIVVVPPASP
jgi:nucleotide-binding universal stress UspA family protein